jgi:glycosyltransferase involved in cell wall biosynthesis
MANIVIYSPNVVGKSMAGPAIRAWEFAKALSKLHDVTLVAPNKADVESSDFRILRGGDLSLANHLKKADVMITQTVELSLAVFAKRHGVRLIVDAYDPAPLELLEQLKELPEAEKKAIQKARVGNLNFGFKMADCILCASEKQRDLWIGMLMGQKLITPALYEGDSSLRQYIDVVPFGLTNKPPQKTGPGLRAKYGFKASDKVVLWGGGIWNWFDPLSLVKAIGLLAQKRDDIKLVFMGIKNPDLGIPEMSMSTQAIELAKELGLLDKHVFFNYGWVPYEERQNHLLDADIGVSTHFNHLETRFSFRTRLLDYIWAELPILATEGDSFADIIRQKGLGIVVPYMDEVAIVDAIESLIENPERIREIKSRLRVLQPEFYWDRVVGPINTMIGKFDLMHKKAWSLRDLRECLSFFGNKVREKGVRTCLKKIFSKGSI